MVCVCTCTRTHVNIWRGGEWGKDLRKEGWAANQRMIWKRKRSNPDKKNYMFRGVM